MARSNDPSTVNNENDKSEYHGTESHVELDDDVQSLTSRWLHGSFEFRKDALDRKLHRPQITGIGFSGAVGIGLFITCSDIITLCGPVGAVLSFSLAALVIISVMRSLAEMVSVRPVKGALMDYPATFVDKALGVAVGIVYCLANCLSMVTLTIQAAELIEYWNSGFGVGWAVLLQLGFILICNCLGVEFYGTLERVFKWCKIQIILALLVIMIAVRAGAGPNEVHHGDYTISPGYNSTAFDPANPSYPYSAKVIDHPIDIPGSWGRILAIWTGTTSAMFQFMGGDIVLTTAAEAIHPRRDLPKAARFMYLLPVSFYIIAIILVGFNINYLDPRHVHPHIDGELLTAKRSPFIIPIIDAGIRGLPGFFNACFMCSALTAANTALYASSRTLFALARSSRYARIRNSIGRTNNGGTPLLAIVISFLPGLLAFLGTRAGRATFDEPISVLSRIYTGGMLCVYGSECLAFIRFQQEMRRYKRLINRDSEHYIRHHYRAHWQPLWAIFGLVACTLLMLFTGWTAIYELCKVRKIDGQRVQIVGKGGSAFAIVAAYIGPFTFFAVYLGYKWANGTTLETDFSDVWFPIDVPNEDGSQEVSRWRRKIQRLREFISWLK